MKAKLISIGNSRGLRLPKVWLDQLELKDEVEIDLEADGITIRPVQNARAGWEAKFVEMAKRGDDKLLDPETTTTFDHEEWEW